MHTTVPDCWFVECPQEFEKHQGLRDVLFAAAAWVTAGRVVRARVGGMGSELPRHEYLLSVVSFRCTLGSAGNTACWVWSARVSLCDPEDPNKERGGPHHPCLKRSTFLNCSKCTITSHSARSSMCDLEEKGRSESWGASIDARHLPSVSGEGGDVGPSRTTNALIQVML